MHYYEKILLSYHLLFNIIFSNRVTKNYSFEEFCNYHRTHGHLPKDYKVLKNIIQDLFIKRIYKLMMIHLKSIMILTLPIFTMENWISSPTLFHELEPTYQRFDQYSKYQRFFDVLIF